MNWGNMFLRWPYTDLQNLNLDWLIAVCKDLTTNLPTTFENIEKEIDNKLNKALNDGTLGDILTSNGDGTSTWKPFDSALANTVINAVNTWLNNHPEATTTVQDNSITKPKLNTSLVNELKGLPFDLNPVITPELTIWKNIPSGYAFPQGFCLYDGALYIGYSSPDNGQNGLIQKYKNGVYTNLSGEFYHMNSLCTDGEFIYSLDCLSGNNPSTTLNTVTIIDINTFSYATRVTLNYTGSGNLAGLMYNNGLYCVDTLGKVYSIDENYDLTLYCTLNNLTGTMQQTYMDNNYIYIATTYPNTIYIYSHTGTIENIINLGNKIDNLSPITELEAVYIYNNAMYIRVATTTNEDMIIKTELNRSTKNTTPMYVGNFVTTLHVDGNPNTQSRINSLYFETLQNAINYASCYTNSKFIISLETNTDQPIEINDENLNLRIDCASGVVYSGSIILRAGKLTLQNVNVDVTNIDEFIYISNPCNAVCELSITGTITGVCTTNFIRTYGKCDVYCAVTSDNGNTITLGAYANLELNCNLVVNQGQYSNVYSNGIVNNVSGYLRGGVPVAVSVNIPLTTADTEITQTGRNAQQNTHIELRTNDGSKNDFYLTTTNVQIMPFYVVNDNQFEIYYIRLRRDANNKLYAMLINPPSSSVSINLIIYH